MIIFVQPRTTAQLAAAFLITFAFLIMHVLVVPFAQEAENSTQFWCQISILLVLFSGIIARATSEDAFYRDTGSYNSALIGIVLAASQTGILLIFVFKLRPEGPKPALEIERIAASAITDAIEEQSECLLNEISSQADALVRKGVISPQHQDLVSEVIDACRASASQTVLNILIRYIHTFNT